MYFIVIPCTPMGICSNYVSLKSGVNNYFYDLMIFNSNDIKYMDHFTNYYIRIVINLNPKYIIDKSFILPQSPRSYHIKRNTNFILSDQISSQSIKSIITFGLPITFGYIIGSCNYNCIKILDYLHDNNKIKKFWIPYVIHQVCQHGNPKILEWFRNVNLLCPETLFVKNNIIAYDAYIDIASARGNINVLNWWINSKLPLKYSINALDHASQNGHVNVLDWWFLKSNLPLIYTENSMNYASEFNHINVLNWWVNSNLPLKYSDSAFYGAYVKGNIDILDWWINSNLPLKYNDYILIASIKLLKLKLLKSLEWFKKSGLTLTINKFTFKFILNNEPEYIGILMNYFKFPLHYRLRYYYYKLKLHSN
jgi:hypothetical protein